MPTREAFERDRTIAMSWFNKSSDLRAAAAAVWVGQDDDVSPLVVQRCALGRGFDMRVATADVFCMLAGMSLELIYKATLVTTSQIIPYTHDLNRLAALAGLQVVPSDEPLLRILTGAIMWDGRYPVPRELEQYDSQRQLQREHLFDDLSDSTLRVYTPNGALGWPDCGRLWASAADHFWTRHRAE